MSRLHPSLAGRGTELVLRLAAIHLCSAAQNKCSSAALHQMGYQPAQGSERRAPTPRLLPHGGFSWSFHSSKCWRCKDSKLSSHPTPILGCEQGVQGVNGNEKLPEVYAKTIEEKTIILLKRSVPLRTFPVETSQAWTTQACCSSCRCKFLQKRKKKRNV